MSEYEATEEVADELTPHTNGEAPLPIGTVAEILERAPSDIVEETLEIPEWDCSVKVRSFTAAQNARVKQKSVILGKGDPDVAWAEMEVAQFLAGVIEPAFDELQVRELHSSSGRGFQRVIDWLDEKSGNDKEELRKAQREFRE